MKRTRPVLVLALSSLLALTACGSDGDVDADASATPSTSVDPTVCPTTPTEVPGTPGQPANTDLDVKPRIIKGPAPTPTTITYTDIVEGQGAEVKGGSQIALKYVGALYANGKEFDASWGRSVGQDTFPLTACTQGGGAIDGFLIGPIGMKVGGRRQINIPASFGYGDKAQGADIPANSALIFVVDLVQVDGEPPLPTAAPTSAPAATAPAATPTPAATASSTASATTAP